MVKEKIDEPHAKKLQATSAANESLNAIHEIIANHDEEIESFKAEILGVNEEIKASQSTAHTNAIHEAIVNFPDQIESAKAEILDTIDRKIKESKASGQNYVCDKLEDCQRCIDHNVEIFNRNIAVAEEKMNDLRDLISSCVLEQQASGLAPSSPSLIVPCSQANGADFNK